MLSSPQLLGKYKIDNMRKHSCVCPICTTLSRGRAKFTCMSLDDLCHLWTVWSINRTQGVTMIRFILTVPYTSFSGQGVSHALQYIIGKGRGKSENFSLHKRYYCRLTESDQVKGFFSVIDLQYILYSTEVRKISFRSVKRKVLSDLPAWNQLKKVLGLIRPSRHSSLFRLHQNNNNNKVYSPVGWSDFWENKLNTRLFVPCFSTPHSKISLVLLFLALQDLSNLN